VVWYRKVSDAGPKIENMTSSPESRLKLDHEIQLSDAANAVHPAGSESKQGSNSTTASQAESLLAAEKRTLEMMANGASLSEVLNDLCAAIDAHAPPVSSMVCLMEGESLTPCAGPHVPAAFKAAITPWRIGPDRASCGAAAFTKQRVIVPNISNDPRWPDDARDLTLSHGFSAAWSEPLISKDGEVLGTFAMYYPEPRTPVSSDFELISAAGHIARIAIELERSHLALKNALVEIKISENKLRTIIDTMPDLAWSARSDGSADFFNQRWLDYTGLSAEQALNWGWEIAIYPDDLARMLETFQEAVNSGKPFEMEGRLRRSDGVFRWFLFRGNPVLDESGRVVKWYGTNTDLEERKRAEQILRSNEQSLRLIVDTIPGFVCTLNAAGEVELLNRQLLEYFGKTTAELKNWATSDAVHPDDLPGVIDTWRISVETGQPYAFELRQRRADGVYRWFQSRALPSRDTEGRITGWYMLLTDIDDRKRAEDALRENEQSLRLIVDTIPGFVWTMTATGEVERANQQLLHYLGKTLEELKEWVLFLHPDDRARVLAHWRHTIESGRPYEVEHRLRRVDGVYRWFQVRGRPQHDAEGRIVRWYNLVTDIDDRKRAEDELGKAFEKIAKSEAELRTIIDAIPQLIVAIGIDGTFLFANRAVLEYTGLTNEEVRSERFYEVFHREDSERLRDQREAAISRGVPFEYERRVRRRDGQYRWFLVQYNPLRDERGGIIRWYATATDIDDRKQAEERAQQENVALREQIDQAFMFEEIVGSSPALKTVLSSIVKVAPTDTTVLITGETGTGKELIARAIHKGSQRASQPFIAVNCASIPASLIASELFGHEKGAFTGALQRRQGRFELANSGTIFLDEIGELPAETQIALLRVLQERQFERVGGNRVIPTDVRIIAATNRDLSAAIAAGTFRTDLFYRLNVFPIHVPPLRNRREDIPMLVEYFVKRYAEKARKQITKIDKNTLKLCQSYPWPGNIRELQNIIERSVILCTGDTFWIDEAWLSSQDAPRLDSSGPLTQTLQNHEKELIEAALGESKGKVAGPNGAAAKLGIHRSTLELKIKQLNIKKHTFR
jgi:formate hydrogenlyase transcriptional activator